MEVKVSGGFLIYVNGDHFSMLIQEFNGKVQGGNYCLQLVQQ